MAEKISEYLEENISQMVRVINMSYKISKASFVWQKKMEENKKNIEFLSNENPSIKAVLEMKYIDAYQKLFVNADIQCIEEKYHSILTMSPTLNTIVQDKLDSHEEDKYWKKLKEVAQCQFLNHFLNTKIRKPRINRKKN